MLIIMPAHNEEENIVNVLTQLAAPEITEIADVLVMNDASSDKTNRIVKEKGHLLVTNVFNLGYGSAIQMGYKYAIRKRYKYVIQMDADGQHDVCNIPVLYERLRTPNERGECPDIVLGSRFVEGSSEYAVPFTKKIAFCLFRFLIKRITGKKINDPTTGLQALSWRATLYYSRYGHFDDKYPDANMIIQMLLLGYRVEEAPAVMHNREHGVSMHSGLKPLVYLFRMIFSILAVVFRIQVLERNAKREIDDVFY